MGMLLAVDIRIRDAPAKARYEAYVDGDLAGFAEYRLSESTITMFHTEIEPRYTGRGVASKLISYALTDIRARGLSLVPICPFVAAYIAEHPDAYLDLVVPQMQKRVSGLARGA